MAAYLIGDLEVHEPDAFRDYTTGVQATLDPFQGRFLVRAGAYEVAEGTFEAERLVLIEFPSIEQARAWYNSDAYQALLKTRQNLATANFITLMEGVAA